jgi:hypothetical protein
LPYPVEKVEKLLATAKFYIVKKDDKNGIIFKENPSKRKQSKSLYLLQIASAALFI